MDNFTNSFGLENKVSIIIPVYNVESYLEQCVTSLVNQTYQNIEIILVDDGSKDKSGFICEKLAEKDCRITVIHKENAGLGFARNTGLDLASGEYVTFIDSDDFVEKDLIQNLMEGLKKFSADTCVGGYRRVSASGKELYKEQYELRTYCGEQVYQEFFLRMLGSAPDKHDSIKMSVWNSLYSMDLIKKNNIRFFSERVMISEDVIFNSDYYKYAKCVSVINSVSYCYRITEGSVTNKYKPDRTEMVCLLYEEMERRISGKFKTEEAIYRLQKQFFINIRMCISQEMSKSSNKNIVMIINSIRHICEMETVERVAASYPIHSLKWKARIFALLIKYKAAKTLTCLAEMNVM